MVLSDRDLRQALCRGDLVVDPLDDNRVQPASIDLTLASKFLVSHDESPYPPPIDLADVRGTLELEPMVGVTCGVGQPDYLYLGPQQFCLGSTVERVEIPDYLVARVEGKSSLGRLGLIVHATAGYIDPGFKGTITLEIYNLNYRPIILHPGRAICQLSLISLTTPAVYPYGHEKNKSRYQNQTVVTASRYEG
jgi:dCTP deaminase